MNIFVGNLSRKTEQKKLLEKFQEFGSVTSFNYLIDKINGEWKTFAFVEMMNEDDAQRAIDELDGLEIDGKIISVHISRWRREDRRKSGRGGGRRWNDAEPKKW